MLEHTVIALSKVISIDYNITKEFTINVTGLGPIIFKYNNEKDSDKAFIEFLHAWSEYYSKTQVVFYGN